MSMPRSVRYSPGRATRAQLTGRNRTGVAVVLIAFAVAHLIGALLLQRSPPANPDAIVSTTYHD